jgi:hypothetical protein
MSPNLFLYELARKVHYQDLRREIKNQQLLATLPPCKYSMTRRTIYSLTMLRPQSSAWLKQLVQPRATPEKGIE